MTKIVVQPNASGTGTFTIAAPNSNNARTLTLPDAAGTVFLSDGSGTIQPTNITDGTTTVGTSYVVNGAAKAWSNLNGTGTIALRDSLNIASVVDRGTGDYTNNLTSSMANADYSIKGDGDQNQYYFVVVSSVTLTSSAYAYGYYYAPSATTDTDVSYAYTLIHGDLA